MGSALRDRRRSARWYCEYLTTGWPRVLGAGIATYAVENQQEPAQLPDHGQTGCTSMKGVGLALLGLAGIAFIGGMAYDVAIRQIRPIATTRATACGRAGDHAGQRAGRAARRHLRSISARRARRERRREIGGPDPADDRAD